LLEFFRNRCRDASSMSSLLESVLEVSESVFEVPELVQTVQVSVVCRAEVLESTSVLEASESPVDVSMLKRKRKRTRC
jgi:hypothetical protein